MAERRAKVIWTEAEEDKLFPALAQVYKSDPKASAKKAGDLAQMVLPENRRRNLQSPLHFPTRLRSRMIAAGMLKLEASVPATVDKNLERINQLADERDTLTRERDDLKTQNEGLVRTVLEFRRELEKIPTEAQVLKRFVADILWDVECRKRALPGPTSADVNKAVLGSTQSAVLPRRHEAEPQSPEGRSRKAKVVLVGGGYEHTFVENELRHEPLDLRLFDTREGSSPIGERLKAFKIPEHGVVILWANKANHADEASLKFHNIPFLLYRGDRGGIISLIRQQISERVKAA